MILENKVAIITGGSSGIGFEVARRLASEGASVALVARDRAKLQDAVSRIEGEGGRALAVAADVSDFAQAETVVPAVEQAFGPADILVNAAGVFFPTPVGDSDPLLVQRMIQVNMGGVIAMTHAVAPGMKARGDGAIVNFASVAGHLPVGGYAVYGATKAAVAMLTRVWARDLAPFGVRVNAVAPGNTETPMNEGARADASIVEHYARLTPTGRPFSPPSEMAELALFLASGRVRALCGAIIHADEGLSLGI
jgi:3-oxoacyl-[acyl-carrier protein] reductase